MIVKYNKSVTPSSGSASFNTDTIKGVIHSIIVIPTTETTTYDLKLTDDNSVDVYDDKGILGTLRDNTQRTVWGVYTVTISNASVDESFTVQIELKEDA